MTPKPIKKEPLWTKSFILITLCNLFIFLSFAGLPSFLPLYLKSAEVGAPDGIIGITVGITTVIAVIFRPIAGAGIDKPGGRHLFFILGMLGMAITTALLGMSPSIVFIFIIRLLSGIAWAATNTAASTIATDVIPRSRLGEGIGFYSISGSLALGIAPAVALFLYSDIHISFWVIALGSATLVVFAIVLSFFLRFSQPKEARAAARAARQQSLQENAEKQVARSARQRGAGFSLKNLFEKSSLLPAGIIFANCLALGAVTSFMSLHATERGIEGFSLYFVVYAVVLLVSRSSAGRLADKKGYRLPVLSGLVIMILALLFTATAQSLVMLILAGVLFGGGQGLVVSSLQTMAVADVPFERRGAANSTFFTGFDAGIGIGSLAAGLIATFAGYGNLFFIMMIAPALGFAAFLYLARKRSNFPSQSTVPSKSLRKDSEYEISESSFKDLEDEIPVSEQAVLEVVD